MFRMVQVLEYQTEKSAINNVKVSSVEKNSWYVIPLKHYV